MSGRAGRLVVAAAVVALMFGACSQSQHASHTGTTHPTRSPTSTTLNEAAAREAYDAAAAAFPKFELASVPPGYGDPTIEAGADAFTMTYAANGGFFGDRLTLQVTAAATDASAGYLHLSDHSVRAGKSASFFTVSRDAGDPHARHGLTWVETPQSRITLFGPKSDPTFYLQLAESVRPRQ